MRVDILPADQAAIERELPDRSELFQKEITGDVVFGYKIFDKANNPCRLPGVQSEDKERLLQMFPFQR